MESDKEKNILAKDFFLKQKEKLKKVNPNSFYNIANLLRQTDSLGNQPEIFVTCSNRSAGKTTSVNRFFFEAWLEGYCRQAMFLVRYENEIKGVADTIMNIAFLTHFFPDNPELLDWREEQYLKGAVSCVIVQDRICFWICAVNTADKVKRASNLFYNVDLMIFDEFMPETGAYASDEVNKLKSIHVSISRCIGQQVRYVPVIMMSNLVDMFNPYFVSWGISSRLNVNQRYLRGEGLVVEHVFNKNAALGHEKSAFLGTFGGGSEYYTERGVYLLGNSDFIGKVKGACDYVITIVCDGKMYGVKTIKSGSLIYFDSRPDIQNSLKFACTDKDCTDDIPLLKDRLQLYMMIKKFIMQGKARFENQEVKNVVFDIIMNQGGFRYGDD